MKIAPTQNLVTPFLYFIVIQFLILAQTYYVIICILLLAYKCVLPVITSFPAVALNLVSPVRRCLVRHWYVFFPSSLLTFLICSSPDGKTTYFPSYLNREERTLDTCHKLTKYNLLIHNYYHKISYYFIKIILCYGDASSRHLLI